MTAFEEFGVLPEIAKAVDEMEWTLPTDVQAEAVPLILGGGDVLMTAETGSGKTGAFCLPILQIVWDTLRDIREGKGAKAVAAGTVTPWTMSFFDRGSALVVTPDGLGCQSREFNTKFTDIDYIPIFTEVSQFDSYKKIEVFCKENSSKSI